MGLLTASTGVARCCSPASLSTFAIGVAGCAVVRTLIRIQREPLESGVGRRAALFALQLHGARSLGRPGRRGAGRDAVTQRSARSSSPRARLGGDVGVCERHAAGRLRPMLHMYLRGVGA